MHPEILTLGPLHLRSYGLMLAIAFLVGIWLAQREARSRGLDPDKVLNLGLVVLVAGVAGARLLYVAGHPSEFAGRWYQALFLWQGGLTLWGGFLVGIPAGLYYCVRARLPKWEAADILAGPVALGGAIGRFGCFLNGCCYGLPTTLPWGVSFPEGSLPYAQFGPSPLHPSQLYNVLAGLGVFVVVTVLAPRFRAPGQRFWFMMGLFAVARAAVDVTRYYEPNAYAGHLGPIGIAESQVLGVGILLISIGFYLLLGARHARARALAPAVSPGPASPGPPPAALATDPATPARTG